MQLRKYQQIAVDAIIKDISRDGNSIVTLPTGSGKSLVIAEAVRCLGKTTLILCPSKEILQQNYEKLLRYVPQEDIGVYSASMGRKDLSKYTFATIQSIYKKPELFAHIPLVFVDESHGVNVKDLETMYASFFKSINNPKIIGFSATPFRLDVGYTYEKNIFGSYDTISNTVLRIITRMKSKKAVAPFWRNIIHNTTHQSLVEDNFLTPIEYIHEPLTTYEEIPVNKSRSDFNLDAYTESIIGFEAVILSTIAEAQKKYSSVLVFCASTAQAEMLSKTVVGSGLVLGTTKTRDRENLISGFKSGRIRTMISVLCLATGFDYPDLRCIINIRPCKSPLLICQIAGRLSRLSPGKTSGVLIDLTGTYKNFGKIESVAMYKNERNLWDLKTEKKESWHGRVLFKMKIQK